MLCLGSSLFCLVLFAVPLLAQPAFSKSSGADGLIKLDVVVTDKAGNPISGLRSSDLTLLDSGRPQKILSFHGFDEITAKPDEPVELILVIDTVNLSQEQVAAAKNSAEKFLRANDGHLAQPVQVFLLSPTVLSSTRASSTDGNTLADQVARGTDLPVTKPTMVLRPAQTYRVIDGKPEMTPAGEANRISLNALGAIAIEERRKPGRKLLFWIGPGWPVDQGGCDISFDSVTELSARLREARVTLWTVNAWPYREPYFFYHDLLLQPAKTANDVKSGHLSLVVLAAQSGGGMLNTAGDLGTRIGEQMQQANAFYTLAFEPPHTQEVDEYHELKVEVAGSGITARTSTAYYDEPTYQDQPSNAQGSHRRSSGTGLVDSPDETREGKEAGSARPSPRHPGNLWTHLSDGLCRSG